MTAQELAETYDGKIVMKRAKATGVDFMVLFLLMAAAGALFNPRELSTAVLICFALSAAYYLLTESLFGRTLGKAVQGLVVVNDEGAKPSFAAVVLRTVPRLLEVNPILFGAAPAGVIANFSSSHQRLGDLLAGTFVVAKKDLPRITHSPFTGGVIEE
ncbi:MAG TPA: RDD family protein [Thermoanaerobaculia bacterium]